MLPLSDSQKTSRFPWVNTTLIVVNILVFIYMFFHCKDPNKLITIFGFTPEYFFDSGWNPLIHLNKYVQVITANFVHLGIAHILGNMIFLAVFGDDVEDKLGHFRYFLFYMVCGIIAVLVHGYMFKESTRVLAGASGAIAGVMGGFYILFPSARIKSLILIFIREIPAVFYIFVWFLFNLIRGFLHLDGIMAEPVAWWAHIGGFIAGAILINLFLYASSPKVNAGIKLKTKRKPA